MDFVVVYAKPAISGITPGNVLVVKKNRPPWQAGRFNLVGGKIEEGETPEDASARELYEEAGLVGIEGLKPRVMGAIYGTWGTVYCVMICVFDKTINPQEGETEEVMWMDWCKLRDSPLLIPNLRVIIPMMMTGVRDWVMKDEGPDWTSQIHKIEVTVNADIA